MRNKLIFIFIMATMLMFVGATIASAGKPDKVDVCFPIGKPEDNKWQHVNVSIKAWENHFSNIEDAFMITEEKPCPPKGDDEIPEPEAFDYILYLPRVLYNVPFSPVCYPWCLPY